MDTTYPPEVPTRADGPAAAFPVAWGAVVRFLGRASDPQRLRERFPFGLTFLAYFVLVAIAFWPGLHRAWYYQDDYPASLIPFQKQWQNCCAMGRPILGLWMHTLHLDARPDQVVMNVALRWLQAGIHVLSATLIAFMLWQECRKWYAALGVLPFLLWSFSAEPVLWRGGGGNILASCFSVAGLLLIRMENPGRASRSWAAWILGSVLIVLGMLTTQAGANLGLAVYAALVGVAAFRGEGFSFRTVFRQGVFLAAGYLVGGLLSVYIARTAVWTDGRVDFTFDWKTKWDFWLHLNTVFLFFPSYYPGFLRVAHGVLCGGTVLLAVVNLIGRAWRERRVPWTSLLGLTCLASLLLLPYASNLAVYHHWICYRNLYNSPLLLTCCLASGALLAHDRRWLLAAYGVVLLVILAPYVYMARAHSRDYVKNERFDLVRMRDIERFSQQCGTDRIVVLDPRVVPIREYNPYQLRYFCGHLSAFATHWTIRPFIERESKRLHMVEDPAIVAAALKQVQAMPSATRPLQFKVLGYDVVAVCPP